MSEKFKVGETCYRMIPDTFKGGEWTYKLDGPFKVMGEIKGYLMVRRPRCKPFVLHQRDALRKASS